MFKSDIQKAKYKKKIFCVKCNISSNSNHQKISLLLVWIEGIRLHQSMSKFSQMWGVDCASAP